MEEGHGAALREVSGGVSVSGEHPLGGEQPLHANGAPRVDAPRTDANLGTCKAKPPSKSEVSYFLLLFFCCLEVRLGVGKVS